MRITIPIVILLRTIMASPPGWAFRYIFWRRMPLQSLMQSQERLHTSQKDILTAFQ